MTGRDVRLMTAALGMTAAATLAGCAADRAQQARLGPTPSPPAALPTSPAAPTAPAPSAPTASGAESAAPVTVDGLFAVEPGRRVAVRCWGSSSKGAPTVFYDAGTGDTGIGESQGSLVVADVAAVVRFCTLDRPGVRDSDPAPDTARNLDDVVDDMHAALDAAGVRSPLLLVGSSGGGFDIYEYAGRYPGEVAGIIMLDVPAGQPDITPSDVPAWDSPENPEHVDYAAVEHQMAVARLPIPPVPVTVVSAKYGQSEDLAEQRVWLVGSSEPRQVRVASGHDVFNEEPSLVGQEVLRLVQRLERPAS